MKRLVPILVFTLLTLTVYADVAASLHDYLGRMEAFGFSGSVAVTRKGETLFERAYGFADRERQLRNTPATIFDTGSLGKQFTGAAILKLEEAGKLRTSDPISKYLDDVPEDKRAITIHQLLTMTAGLAPAGTTAGTAPTREGRLKQLLEEPLIEPPGTRIEYSNGGYNLLAAIIEKVSGTPYEVFVRKSLFEPAGLKSTAFLYERPLPFDAARIANDYAGGEATSAADFPVPLTWFFKGAGGALTTPADLCRWHRALVSGGVLSKDSLAKYYKPGLGENGFAYGWGVFPTPHGRVIEMGGGTTNGVGAKLLRFLDGDVCIAMAINNEGEAFNDPVSAALIAIVFGDSIALPPAVKPMPAAGLAKLAGTYRAGDATFDAAPIERGLRVAAKDAAALALLFGAQDAPDLREKTDPLVRAEVEEDFKGKWRSEFGAVKGFTYLGTTPEPGGDFAANYRIDFEKGSLWMQYIWFPRRLDGVRVLRTPPSLELLPAGGGAFVAADLPAQSFVTARLSGETIAFERTPMRGVAPQRRNAAAVSFPDTKAAAAARRFVDAFNGGEAAVRAFITSEYSPQRLAERSVEERMGGYQATRSRFGASLTLARVVRSTDTEFAAVLRGANGTEGTFAFSLDPDAPGRLASVRFMATN